MNKVVPSGILMIDKPQGITSHDVIDCLRKVLKKVKIGHTGTLDPLATGVMNICIGDATKLSDVLTAEDKVYKVKMLLGVETNTYDITGKISFASVVDKDEIYIKERIKRFIGKQKQKPPIFSAIRVDGKRAYEYAREGKKIELKSRDVEIFDITNIEVDLNNNIVSFKTHVSKGTYIRALVNDIGKKIGCGATMIELKRTCNGNSNIVDAIKLDKFLKLDFDNMIDNITSIKEYFKDNINVYLNEIDFKKLLNGIKLDNELSNQIVKVYENKKYKGLGIIEDNKLRRYIIE